MLPTVGNAKVKETLLSLVSSMSLLPAALQGLVPQHSGFELLADPAELVGEMCHLEGEKGKGEFFCCFLSVTTLSFICCEPIPTLPVA